MLKWISNIKSYKIIMHLMPFVLFAIASIISFISYLNASSELQKNIQNSFLVQSDNIASSIEQRLSIYEQILCGAKGLFDANANNVSRKAWHDYIRSLDLAIRYPGMKSVAFTKVVKQGELSQHIAMLKHEGFNDYSLTITPEAIYAPVMYIEPFDARNRPFFGYDLMRNSDIKQALLEATASGKSTITNKIALARESATTIQTGFAMCIPIYAKNISLKSEQDRTSAIFGFVYAPFGGDDLMRGVLDDTYSSIAFEIYDGKSINPSSLIYSSNQKEEKSAYLDYIPSKEIRMLIYNHEWTIRFLAKNEFADRFDTRMPSLLFVMRELLSFALFLIVMGLVRTRFELAEKIEKELDKSKERDSIVLQQSKMAIMGEMLQNIAHQWRQPLNALSLMNYNLLLKAENNKLDIESIHIHNDKCAKVLSNMSRTIDDFRNFFRPDKTKKHFFLADAVRNAVSIVGASFEDSGITVDVTEVSKHLVCGYQNEFTQVVINILNNAKDELVSAKIIHPEVKVVISKSADDMAELRISDNGKGIPEELLPRIFEPYFTTKEDNGGSGIGLFMSRAIIEKNMKGSISVENNNGAIFIISIPTDENGIEEENNTNE